MFIFMNNNDFRSLSCASSFIIASLSRWEPGIFFRRYFREILHRANTKVYKGPLLYAWCCSLRVTNFEYPNILG